MQLAVLADIHGNLPALQAVLVDIQESNVDGIIVAGDIVVGGPRPVETLEILRTFDPCWMIRGNGEGYLLELVRDNAPTSKQWATTCWTYQHTDQATLDFIAALPEQRVVTLPNAAPIRIVHGSPRSATEHLVPTHDPNILKIFEHEMPDLLFKHIFVDEAFRLCEEPTLICGHSHIAWKVEHHRRIVLNPGSVGVPINGDVRAQYALLTWQSGKWQAHLRAVAYDLARNRANFIESGLLEQGGGMARAFLLDAETGHNSAGALVAYAHGLATQAAWSDGESVPDEIWDRAVATFDWQARGWHK